MRSTTATPLSVSPALPSAIHNDSAAVDRRSFKKSKSVSLEENSQADDGNDDVIDTGEPKRTIEDDIKELKAQLAPIDEPQLQKWHQAELSRIVECTCTVTEIESDATESEPKADGSEAATTAQPTISIHIVSSTETNENHSFEPKAIPSKPIPVPTEHISKPIQPSDEAPSADADKKPTVKSIFDLDYEEDDDPIHTFKIYNNNSINDNNNHNDKRMSCDENFLDEKKSTDAIADEARQLLAKEQPEVGVLNSDEEDDDDADAVADNQSRQPSAAVPVCLPVVADEPPAVEMPPLRRFDVHEDPECAAREFYVTTKTSVTAFHIDLLHNSFVPNVNGNWNECESDPVKEEAVSSEKAALAIDCSDQIGEEEFDAHITEANVGLYERVVPLCNHLVADRLPKNLRNIVFELPPEPIESPRLKEELVEPAAEEECAATDNVSLVNEGDAEASENEELSQDKYLFKLFNADERRILQEKCAFGAKRQRVLSGSTDRPEAGPVNGAEFRESSPILVEANSASNVNEIDEFDDRTFADDSAAPEQPTEELEIGVSMTENDQPEDSDRDATEAIKPVEEQIPILKITNRCKAKNYFPKYKIRRISADDATNDNCKSGDLKSVDNDSESGKAGGKLILKLSRQFTIDGPDENDNDNDDEFAQGDCRYMDNEDNDETSDYSENDNDEEDDEDVQKVYEEDTSNHFITLKNFDTESDSSHEETLSSKQTEPTLFDNIMSEGPIDESIMSECDMDDDSDTVNNVMMFCKPVIDESKSSSNLYGATEISDSQSVLQDDCDENRPSEMLEIQSMNSPVRVELNSLAGVRPEEANHKFDTTNSNNKRTRSYSTSSNSSTSSTSSTSSSDASTLSKKKSKKKLKRWRNRPCPQHYGTVPSTSSSDSSMSSDDHHVKAKAAQQAAAAAEPPPSAAAEPLVNSTDPCPPPSTDDNKNSAVEDVAMSAPESAACASTSYDVNATKSNEEGTSQAPEGVPPIVVKIEADTKNIVKQDLNKYPDLPLENNGLLDSFNNLAAENDDGIKENGYIFREWYEVVHVKSYNDELLTILPYVVID